jgi:hypothetical protein
MDVGTQCKLVGLMVRETLRCISNPHGDPANADSGEPTPRHEKNKFYMLVKRHFVMDVTSKQYKLMCVALLDSLRYCFDKEYTEELRIAWELLFTALLKGLLKYAVAFEIIHLPASAQGSYSSAYFGEDKIQQQSCNPDEMRLMDSYSMLADDDHNDEQPSYGEFDSKPNSISNHSLPSSNGNITVDTTGNTNSLDQGSQLADANAVLVASDAAVGLN